MSGTSKGIVIVGAGHAGARMALCLREEGYAGRLRLVGSEPDAPYERPPLSKEFLLDASYDEARCRVLDIETAAQKGIEFLPSSTVVALDVDARVLRLADDRRLEYDEVVLATGARARPLVIGGVAQHGVLLLRDLNDARRLRDRLAGLARLAVIGGGLIGLEIAAGARTKGVAVTVLEAAPTLLARVAPAEVSEALARLHAAHGVDVRRGARVESLTSDGTAGWIVHDRGEGIVADAVVAGIGASINDELARSSGVECSDLGIHVDEYGRTNAPHVFAVGDAAAFWSRRYGRRLRLETWNHAQEQPAVVAKNMLGHRVAYDPIPWAWTDQYGMNLQFLGEGPVAERYLMRGSIDAGKAVVLGIRGSRVISAWLFNAGGERRWLLRLIDARVEHADERWRDERTPLRDLLPG